MFSFSQEISEGSCQSIDNRGKTQSALVVVEGRFSNPQCNSHYFPFNSSYRSRQPREKKNVQQQFIQLFFKTEILK